MRNYKIIHTKQSNKKFILRLSSLFLITIITLSSLVLIFNFQDNQMNYRGNLDDESLPNDLKKSDLSFFYSPFNYSKVKDFFLNNYLSDLNFDVNTYYRQGDENGNIINDSVYSLDNLLLYNTLLSEELTNEVIFERYLDLKSSSLWYNGNMSLFKYGFIQSIENSTGIKVTRRNLIDNLMPLYLIANQLGGDLTSINIDGTNPKDQLELIFNLINSSEFWDNSNEGFRHFNSSIGTKFTESNLYAILANLLISRTNGLDTSLQDRALELANKTMLSLINNMWEPNIGFSFSSDSDWTNPIQLKYLSVNALGLSALLEFWLEEDNLDHSSDYYGYAVDLYNKIEAELWNPTYQAYEYYRDASWGGGSNTINLEGNTLMMNALLRFFELTGNSTYHSKAMTLFSSFESSFYASSIGAFNYSISTPTVPSDGNKNLYVNLKLCESYINANDIYKQTIIKSEFNSTLSVPNYKFNLEQLTMISNFSFQSNFAQMGIENANITYLIRYPNETIFDILEFKTDENGTHTFNYNITENIPISDGYSIIVYARSDYFKMKSIIKTFNVTSGLELISGLSEITSLYQGQTSNLTLVINNTRNESMNLTLSIEGENIESNSIQVSFVPLNTTSIKVNFTIKADAKTGPNSLFLTIRNGSILYLNQLKSFDIENALQYSNFIYQGKVVGEHILRVSITLTNFLPNNTQTINISFTGEFINSYIKEITLKAQEVKTYNFFLNTTQTTYKDRFNVTMDIIKGELLFYNETFEIEIIPPLEIISYSFPSSVPQGADAVFILIIRNNLEQVQNFRFYANGIRTHINNDELLPGENTIMHKVVPTIIPYDFSAKYYSFILRDAEGDIIHRFYYEITPELSMINLFLFYILPILIPIAIVLFYKNKDIKNKMLKR